MTLCVVATVQNIIRPETHFGETCSTVQALTPLNSVLNYSGPFMVHHRGGENRVGGNSKMVKEEFK